MRRGERRPPRKDKITPAQQAAWREMLRDMITHEESSEGAHVGLAAVTVEEDTEEHMIVRWLWTYGLLQVFRKGRRGEQPWYVPTIKGVVFAGYPLAFARYLVNRWLDDNRHWLKTATNKDVVLGGLSRSYRMGPRHRHKSYFIRHAQLKQLYAEVSDDRDT